ncbi:PKD domain-containing protein [Taibaiella chishuiensis]|uniref:PKD domain-containing protein n=1 Tax=Taibaiella chishuiensis TaxID=1434707 RepID=A0A2P8D816_9BACT|nr:PKD domain-containing protein [Taibaiella chishuiensis]PSK93337.1 PKD domain-containing protein [Taibaiella chishuiensis]
MWNKNTGKIVAITLLVAALLVLSIIGIKSLLPDRGNIKAGVYPRTISNTDSIYFSDSSDFAQKRRWVFSDGFVSLNASGYHKFPSAGIYTAVLTINNKHTDTFQILVNQSTSAFTIQDSLLSIEGSQLVNVGEKNFFRIKGMTNTKLFTWTFGDGEEQITVKPEVQHTYTVPGKYTISLEVDNHNYPVTHQIEVLPSYENTMDSLAALPNIYREYENDFRINLQKIANHPNAAEFATIFNYLKNKYLCGRDKTVSVNVNSKINDFTTYCRGLQYDKGIMIQKVTLSASDNKSTCFDRIEVIQEKKTAP